MFTLELLLLGDTESDILAGCCYILTALLHSDSSTFFLLQKLWLALFSLLCLWIPYQNADSTSYTSFASALKIQHDLLLSLTFSTCFSVCCHRNVDFILALPSSLFPPFLSRVPVLSCLIFSFLFLEVSSQINVGSHRPSLSWKLDSLPVTSAVFIPLISILSKHAVQIALIRMCICSSMPHQLQLLMLVSLVSVPRIKALVLLSTLWLKDCLWNTLPKSSIHLLFKKAIFPDSSLLLLKSLLLSFLLLR